MKSIDPWHRLLLRSGLPSSLLLLSLFPFLCSAADISLERSLQAGLEQSRALVEIARTRLEAGGNCREEIARLKTRAEGVKSSYLLLQEKFRLREEILRTGNARALARHQAMAGDLRSALNRYLSLVESLQPGNPSPAVLDRLLELLEGIFPKRTAPLLGTLPYRHLNDPAVEPDPSPPIKPAYKGGNKAVSPADLKNTEEAPIDRETATLAQSLNWNPVAIYEYVKNNIETEWYWGCMKGSQETLRQKSGNDCDQASLLAALLRSSGFPARYVRGTMAFYPGIGRAKNLTGIEDPLKLADFFRKAGIPFGPVIAGGTIENFRIEHIWVESLIPYSNYRGAVIDAHGKTWLGLDTSIKARDYLYNNPVDAVAAFPLSGLRDDYLNLSTMETPLDYVKSRLAQNGYPAADVLKTRTLPAEVLNILPAGLQFEQTRITHEYAEIPDELKHKVKFTAATRDGRELFGITVNTLFLSNQKIILGYEPESVDDQAVINAFGGLYNTPSYLLRLRPVLLVNGQRLAVAADGLPMGEEFHLTTELIAPRGAEKTIHIHVAGSLAAIGIAAGQAVPGPASPLPVDARDPDRLLYEEAMHHLARWNQAEDELASLLHLSISRPLPALVTVGNVVEVSSLLGMPHGMAWKGLYIDAAARAVEPVTERQVTDDRVRDFMQLSALQGSILENRIFEEDLNTPAISTAKVLALSKSGGTPVITLDGSNASAVLPTLPYEEAIKADITDAVNQGHTVSIPAQEIADQDWTGTGYLKENPATGEAGYMLSGRIAGGMTTLSPQRWPSPATAEKLGDLYQGTQKTVHITFPRDGSTVYASPITVQGLLSNASTRVFVNDKEASITGKTFMVQDVKLIPGINRITATAMDGAGAISTDIATVNYEVVLNTYITSPFDETTLSISPIEVAGIVNDPSARVNVNGIAATVSADGRFLASGVILSEGDNTITAQATKWDGQKDTNSITITYRAVQPAPTPITLSITSPAVNTTRSHPTITVSGTFESSAAEVWIKVNGVVANIYGNRFTANDVPLGDAGSFRILAEAEDSNGTTGRAETTVTVAPGPQVRLTANVTSGIRPFTTYFMANAEMPDVATTYQIDFEGDGIIDYEGSTFDDISHTYALEGIYFPKLTVTDSQGNVLTDTAAITVFSISKIDALLQAKWSSFKNCLLSGAVETALKLMHPSSRQRYQIIFNILKDQLSSIVENYGGIVLDSFEDNSAWYELKTVENNERYSYRLVFIQNINGIWMIREF